MTRPSLLLVVALGLVLVPRAGGAPTWGAPVQLSTGDRALGPELAVDAAGDGLVVWDEEVGSVCPTEPASLSCIHIVQAATRLRGGAWQLPVEISRPGIGSRPTAAIDGADDEAILWVHDIGRDRVVQATYRRGPTGAWPEPNDLSEAVLEIREHQVALDAAGDVVAVWAQRADDTFATYAAIRSSATGAWGAPTRLSGESPVVAGPDLAVSPSGQAAIAWIGADNVVRVVLGDLATASWGLPAARSGPEGPPKRSPRVAVDPAGDVAVVWFAGEPATGGPRKIWHALRPHGMDWRPALELSDAASTATAPAVAIDDAGNVHIAWLGLRGVRAQLAPITGAPSTWGPSIRVSKGGASNPQLAVDRGGNTVAAWTIGAQGSVQAAIAPAGSEWQPQAELSPPDALEPRLAMADRGQAVVVFDRRDGQRAVVATTDLIGNGPVLTGVTGPTRALVVGARGSFSVRPVPWSAPLAGTARWSFGDGSTDAHGTAVRHAFSRPGSYAVTVSQADADGGSSSETIDVSVVRSLVRNRKPPRIQGAPRSGRILTCGRGIWSGSPPIWFRYGWRRDGRAVPHATHARYRVRSTDSGSRITCVVVGTNPAGSARAVSPAIRIAT